MNRFDLSICNSFTFVDLELSQSSQLSHMGPKGTQISMVETMTKGVLLICLIPSLANIFVESLPQNGKSSIMSESIKDGKDESEAKVLVEMLDQVFTSGMNKEMTARWNYIVNITDENEKLQVSIQVHFFRYQ